MWLFNPSTPTSHFYPRSPCGERPKALYMILSLKNFYPRSPCGERPPYILMIHHAKKISIHALLAESDDVSLIYNNRCQGFLSTLSLRRATKFVNLRVVDGSISIHALLAESDRSKTDDRHKTRISIHALLAESDEENPTQKREAKAFLSTLSLRRATRGMSSRTTETANFYPRSPCGERQETHFA